MGEGREREEGRKEEKEGEKKEGRKEGSFVKWNGKKKVLCKIYKRFEVISNLIKRWE